MVYTIGIDEAGRGPLAGPVAIGVMLVCRPAGQLVVEQCHDSKQLSARQRDVLFDHLLEAKKNGDLIRSVALISNKYIDRYGIIAALRVGILHAIRNTIQSLGYQCQKASNCHDFARVTKPYQSQFHLRFDGNHDCGLKAMGRDIETIIQGDAQIPLISAASIVAKVTRDRRMEKQDVHYPLYGFARHKGYGTVSHRNAIADYGLTPLHRKTFCRRFVLGSSL